MIDSDLEKSKEIIASIEESLIRMRDTATKAPLEGINNTIKRQWFLIKILFIALAIMIGLGAFMGYAVLFHFQLDEARYDETHSTMVMLQERTDNLVKSDAILQKQVDRLHPKENNK